MISKNQNIKSSEEIISSEGHIKVKSYSKINLGLWIKEKRPDGYHDLETIFFENKLLFDEIIIDYVKSDDTEIEISFLQEKINTQIPKENNLIFKAAKLILKELKESGKLFFTVDKKVPVQAGLGGGSSNAAQVLININKIFGNKLSSKDLISLGKELGSDVPFFILGNTCFASGQGEILEPIKNNLNLEVEIFKPENISVPTKWAYDELDKKRSIISGENKIKIENIKKSLSTGNFELLCTNLFNDFEEIVFNQYPELLEMKNNNLKKNYPYIGLCGSGSALYGIKHS